MKTSICDSRYKIFSAILLALIYIFRYLNMNEKPTLWHSLPFYILMLFENTILIAMYCMYGIRNKVFSSPASVGFLLCFAVFAVVILMLICAGVRSCKARGKRVWDRGAFPKDSSLSPLHIYFT